MTSEKRFSSSHSAFWNALLPMEEPYLRSQNGNLRPFAYPLVSRVPADQRGTVNECAFLIFAEATERSVPPAQLPQSAVDRCVWDAEAFVRRMHSRVPFAHLEPLAVREAKELATRLDAFVRNCGARTIQVKPLFPGCGWIDDAEGDLLIGSTLVEVKAGERQFRAIDIRQLLSYCALNHSARTYGISSVALLNPRFGIYFEEDLESLCEKVAGSSSASVLGAIVDYISEPFVRYAPEQ